VFIGFDRDNFGDNYEQAAIAAAECLSEIAHDPCLLPENE